MPAKGSRPQAVHAQVAPRSTHLVTVCVLGAPPRRHPPSRHRPTCTGVSAAALFVSTMHPLAIISSMMWWVVSRLDMKGGGRMGSNIRHNWSAT